MNLSPTELTHRSLRNLSTFTTSYMEAEAREIFEAYIPLNGIDINAYPELKNFVLTCENFLLNLTQAASLETFRVLPTSGSSEAIFLSLYYLKRHWQSLVTNTQQPNIIVSQHMHLAWHKAAEFLGIQVRILATQQATLLSDQELLTTLLDNNTLAVCCSLGSPTTLCFDDIFKINQILTHVHQQHGLFVPMHVDAASGGFVVPFIYPHLQWNFKLAHVYSINISSHKYGLVYPTLGWLLMRKIICPDTYAYQSDYLGKTISTYTMRFSHSAAHLAAQSYYCQAKGYDGYQTIIRHLFSLKEQLKYHLAALDEVTLLSPATSPQLPGLVYTLKKPTTYMQQLSDNLRLHNWTLPVYKLTFSNNNLSVARIVLRYGMTEETITRLVSDLKQALYQLMKS